MRFILVFLAAILYGVPAAFADEFSLFTEIPATRDTIRQLRNGGYVLYMRHGTTDPTRPDRVPTVDLNDCATQRPLTRQGRQLMAQIGGFMREARIPVGEVISSPMCRTKESAQAAFGGKFTVNNHLMYSSNMTDQEKAPVLEATRALLSQPVAPKTNRVLVAHAPNLIDLMGYFPRQDGAVVVFQPVGNGFEYVATIAPNQWPAWLK